MTPEEVATDGAAKFVAAESAIRTLAEWVQTARGPLNIPPITFFAIKGAVWGALGNVTDAHLRITPYDPRPGPLDGGGGK